MPRPFHPLTIGEFARVLEAFQFTRKVTSVHVHHTWKPDHSQDRGKPTIEGMYRYHTVECKWSDIAQHVTVDSRGTIWTGRDWNRNPASIKGHNAGAFMFEMIGNFDMNKDTFGGAQKEAAQVLTALVLKKCGLGVEAIRFHNEFSSKSCPGQTIDLVVFRNEVAEILSQPVGALAPSSPELPPKLRLVLEALQPSHKRRSRRGRSRAPSAQPNHELPPDPADAEFNHYQSESMLLEA